MRWFLLVFLLFALLFVGLMGRRGEKHSDRPIIVFPDMDEQYKVLYQEANGQFANGQGARRPVPGTIPMGFTVPEKAVALGGKVTGGWGFGLDYYSTGQFGDYFGDGFPEEVTVDEALLKRGHQRFDIYCTVCHGASGNGQGTAAKFFPGGILPLTANLVDGRVAQLPDGQVFWTITHGKGLMGPYGGSIPIDDRWAIVAYLNALQISQRGDVKDPAVKAAFDAATQAAAPAPAPAK